MNDSSTPPPERPKRRPRYSGKNPRHFHEKYKEHQPGKYPETVRKVLESGKTPAGSHRPIMVSEILEILNPKPGEIGVDATLGAGGHALEILSRILPNGRLLAFDVDPFELPKTKTRLRSQGIPEEALIVCQTNYAALQPMLASHQLDGVDFVLADLGCSSMQLDNPERGFSFKLEGPLDLRMNPNRGRSAAVLLESLDDEKLEKILMENSDEPHARILAKAFVEARTRGPIQTTHELTQIIERSLSGLPGKEREVETRDSIRRVFQALRIAVNEEFQNLERFLKILPSCLKPGGRVAILSFHSGEDRRVKKAFQTALREGMYSRISQDPIRPSPKELRANSRSSSAKLRWAIRAI